MEEYAQFVRGYLDSSDEYPTWEEIIEMCPDPDIRADLQKWEDDIDDPRTLSQVLGFPGFGPKYIVCFPTGEEEC